MPNFTPRLVFPLARVGGGARASRTPLPFLSVCYDFLVTAPLSSIELFAGAGGLAQGVAQAGFHPRLVAEWNRDACQSLRENQ